MNVLRSVAAVILGYVLFAVSAALLFQLLGANPHAPQSMAFMTGTIVYGIAFAFLGGMIAARAGPGRPALQARAVSMLIAAGAIASLLASPSSDATWSQWAALLLMAPAASLAPILVHRR